MEMKPLPAACTPEDGNGLQRGSHLVQMSDLKPTKGTLASPKCIPKPGQGMLVYSALCESGFFIKPGVLTR